MKLRYAVVCDHASLDQGSKASLTGVFSTIWVTALPAALPRFFAVAEVYVDVADIRPLVNVVIAVVAPDESVIISSRSEMATKPAGNSPLKTMTMMVDLASMPLSEAGVYRIDFNFDDILSVSAPFAVVVAEGVS